MNKKHIIRFIADDDIFSIVPFLRMLDNRISEDILKERLLKMLEYKYQCAGIYDGDKLIGISGVWTLFKYYIGKHLEVDNVMIHRDYQGKGIGRLLLNWINDYGKTIGCTATELNCYIGNDRSNAFWEEFGCKKLGYHYRKTY